jgi:hypothetical protein
MFTLLFDAIYNIYFIIPNLATQKINVLRLLARPIYTGIIRIVRNPLGC